MCMESKEKCMAMRIPIDYSMVPRYSQDGVLFESSKVLVASVLRLQVSP